MSLKEYTVELHRLEHLWSHENLFEKRVVRANEVNHSPRSGGIIGIYFQIFLNTKVCFVFSLESPHGGDSKEYTQHTIITIKKKITLNYPKNNNVCSYGIFFLGTQEQVRNSRGKRAISVRATEVLLYRAPKNNPSSKQGSALVTTENNFCKIATKAYSYIFSYP